MALGYYGDFLVSINGALLSESSDVTWATATADSDVTTQLGGFSGITPHGSQTTYSVTLFDPLSGSKLSDLQGWQDDRAIVDLAVIQTATGKKMACKAFVRNVKGSASVGSNATISFDAVGPEAAFV
jgi:hypothetical protein